MSTLSELKKRHKTFFQRGYKKYFNVIKDGTVTSNQTIFYWEYRDQPSGRFFFVFNEYYNGMLRIHPDSTDGVDESTAMRLMNTKRKLIRGKLFSTTS